jgi:hypothetical protein
VARGAILDAELRGWRRQDHSIDALDQLERMLRRFEIRAAYEHAFRNPLLNLCADHFFCVCVVTNEAKLAARGNFAQLPPRHRVQVISDWMDAPPEGLRQYLHLVVVEDARHQMLDALGQRLGSRTQIVQQPLLHVNPKACLEILGGLLRLVGGALDKSHAGVTRIEGGSALLNQLAQGDRANAELACFREGTLD